MYTAVTNSAAARRPSPPAFRRGFTLVEILAVVTILGIAAAVIIPQIGNRDDLRAISAAREIIADLSYAQSQAVSTQKAQYVRFDTTNNRYELLTQISPSDVFVIHPVNRSTFSVPLGAGRKDDLKYVRLDQITFDGRTVLMYDEMGTPYWYDPTTQTSGAMAAGSIRLKSNAYTVTINIQPYSGELKIN
jgi:prepilin-type N-terminal cleavage/methylation domain-containing protein